MADEVAANQETGAQTTEANPRVGADGTAPTTEQQAIAAIAARLEPETAPTNSAEQESPTETANQDAEPDRTAEPESRDEGTVEETSSEDDATTEPTDTGEELPDTLSGLAEAIGMDEAELAKHVKMPIRVNGETQMVTLADAASGQQMDADYRQKTSALAEERRHFESERQQASQLLQQRLQAADERIAALSQRMETEYPAAEMTRLASEDPAEYVRVKAQLEAQQSALIGQHQAQEAERARVNQEREASVAQFREQQQQILVDKIPELTDPDKLETFETGMATYLGDVGFTNDEISGFVGGAFDARQVMLIRDAMRYRGMQDQKKTITKKLKGLPRVQRPGVSTTGRRAQAGDDIAEAKNRIQRAGATDGDAVNYIRQLLE